MTTPEHWDPSTAPRYSVRRRTADGVGDVIGLLIFRDDDHIVLEDRRGVRHTIARDRIIASRRVPDRPAGRRPAPPTGC